jgi:hypothetical protein
MSTPHISPFEFPVDRFAIGDIWRFKSGAIEIRIKELRGIAVMCSRINEAGKTEDEVFPVLPSDMRRFYFRAPYQGTSS